MKKRIFVLAALALTLALMGGCAEKDEKEGLYAPEILGTVGAEDLGVAYFTDAVFTGDGYLIMAMPDYASLPELITLKSDLTVAGRQEIDGQFLPLVREVNGRGRQATPEEAAAKPDADAMGRLTYIVDGTRYDIAGAALYRDGDSVDLPSGEDSTCHAVDIVTVSGKTYIVLEERVTQGESSEWERTWLCPLDGETTEVSDSGISVPFKVVACATGGDKGWLVSDDGVLYRAEGETIEPYADLNAAGVDISRLVRLGKTSGGFMVLSREELTVIAGEGTPDGGHDWEPEDLKPPEKQVIRLATTSSETYSKAVAQFNRENPSYTIERVVYADVANINLALANGEVDLVTSYDYTHMWGWAHKGLLADLGEVAPELFEDGVLVPSFVTAMKINGTCYFLPVTVGVSGFTVPEGDQSSFSDIGEFLDYVESDYSYIDYQAVPAISLIVGTYGDMWLDLESGTANFNSESFARVLEFCAGCSERHVQGTAKIPDDDEEFPYFSMNGFRGMAPSEEERNEGQAGSVPVTIPTKNSSGLRAAPADCLGVVSGGNEAGAAEFLSWLILQGPLDPTRDSAGDIPIAECRMEAYLNAKDDVLRDDRLTEGEREMTLEYLPMLDHVNMIGADLSLRVIRPEAMTYINGDCTLEEALERIQSRVSLYLAELG